MKSAGLGELTVVGMRQRYNLGVNTRLRYPNLLKDLKYNEWSVLSTNFNRTIMSGVSHIMGLGQKITEKKLVFANDDPRTLPPESPLFFDPKKDDPVTPLNQGYVPFPTHNFIGDQDHILEALHTCPLATKIIDASKKTLIEEVQKSEKFKATLEKAKKLYNVTKETFTEDEPDSYKCFIIADYMIMDHLNNKDSEVVVKPNDIFYKHLEKCYSLTILYEFANPQASKLAISPALDMIRTAFKSKIADPEKFPQKY